MNGILVMEVQFQQMHALSHRLFRGLSQLSGQSEQAPVAPDEEESWQIPSTDVP